MVFLRVFSVFFLFHSRLALYSSFPLHNKRQSTSERTVGKEWEHNTKKKTLDGILRAYVNGKMCKAPIGKNYYAIIIFIRNSGPSWEGLNYQKNAERVVRIRSWIDSFIVEKFDMERGGQKWACILYVFQMCTMQNIYGIIIRLYAYGKYVFSLHAFDTIWPFSICGPKVASARSIWVKWAFSLI